LGLLLIALAQQTEELGLKRGLQQTVILSFMKNEEVILPCATGKLRKTFFFIFPEENNGAHLSKTTRMQSSNSTCIWNNIIRIISIWLVFLGTFLGWSWSPMP